MRRLPRARVSVVPHDGEDGRAVSEVGEGLVLSVFPGIDLLGRAFEEEGFCVVRGPDVMWGGDIRTFHPPAGVFAGVVGGPPCQMHSGAAALFRASGGEIPPDLTGEFVRVVGDAKPRWWLMEQVRGAPIPQVPGYAVWANVLNAREFGMEQHRARRIVFGVRGDGPPVDLWRTLELAPLQAVERAGTVLASGAMGKRNRRVVRAGGRVVMERTKFGATRRSVTEALRLQGLPEGWLDDCPLTIAGKQRVIGNGVPMEMGRALAAAVRSALMDGEGAFAGDNGLEENHA